MKRAANGLFSLGLGVSLMILASGCSYSLMGEAELSETYFSLDEASRLEEGASTSEVQALLGNPILVESSGEQETWYYHAVLQERGCIVRLLGLVPIRRPEVATREAWMFFEGRTLSRVETRLRQGRFPAGLKRGRSSR